MARAGPLHLKIPSINSSIVTCAQVLLPRTFLDMKKLARLDTKWTLLYDNQHIRIRYKATWKMLEEIIRELSHLATHILWHKKNDHLKKKKQMNKKHRHSTVKIQRQLSPLAASPSPGIRPEKEVVRKKSKLNPNGRPKMEIILLKKSKTKIKKPFILKKNTLTLGMPTTIRPKPQKGHQGGV